MWHLYAKGLRGGDGSARGTEESAIATALVEGRLLRGEDGRSEIAVEGIEKRASGDNAPVDRSRSEAGFLKSEKIIYRMSRSDGVDRDPKSIEKAIEAKEIEGVGAQGGERCALQEMSFEKEPRLGDDVVIAEDEPRRIVWMCGSADGDQGVLPDKVVARASCVVCIA
jgi:hypothetical protein